jgi:TolA-binding protein
MKKLTVILFALSLLGIFSLASCGDDASSEQAKQEVNEAADAVGDAIVDEKNDLKREMNEATAKIDRRIEALKNDMKNATDEAKVKMQEELDQLEAKRKQIAQDLENFGDRTGAEWEQFKANVQETIKDIGEDNKK